VVEDTFNSPRNVKTAQYFSPLERLIAGSSRHETSSLRLNTAGKLLNAGSWLAEDQTNLTHQRVK